MTQPSEDLHREFGDLDIYLFDQLHRGRIVQGMRVLDGGCGGGRNLTYLLRRGFDIRGTDRDEKALASARANAATLAPSLPAELSRGAAGKDVVRRCLVRRGYQQRGAVSALT